ncbi:MAG: hypothetical protein KJ674_00070 [Nanoarchaeota archaeon]|nr:hypothetical protein [Nanoarchaeota archaeon]
MVKKYGRYFFVSFILAVLIFISGLILGFNLDSLRVDDAVSSLKYNELNSESYVIENEFIDVFGGDKCELLEPRFSTLSSELGDLGRDLVSYESKTMFNKAYYEEMRREYFLLEMRTYTYLYQLKDECGYDIDLILFFYDIEDTESERQGYVLDSLVRGEDNLYVFSFDRDFELDAAINTFKLHYDVVSVPTLIINDDIKKEGFVSLFELRELV